MSSARRMRMLGRAGGSWAAPAGTPAASNSESSSVFLMVRMEQRAGAFGSGDSSGLLERLEGRLVLRPPGAPGLRRAVRLVGDLVERLIDRGDELLGALAGVLVAAADRDAAAGGAGHRGGVVDAAGRRLLDLLLLGEEGDQR